MKSMTYNWQDGKSLTIGEKTLVMGILNVTPDSFSDGGLWNDKDKALALALSLWGRRRRLPGLSLF